MFEVALAQKTISMGVCCSIEVNSVKMCHSKPRVSNHVTFFFHFLRRIQVSLIDLTAKRDANLSDDQRCKCRYNLIVVDNTHRFACFIRAPTVIALYKHRGHLKITVIVSAVLHSLTRYTLLITANAFQIISISFGESSFVHLLRQL